MKDTRKLRSMGATFAVAGILAVIGEHYLGPAIKKKARK